MPSSSIMIRPRSGLWASKINCSAAAILSALMCWSSGTLRRAAATGGLTSERSATTRARAARMGAPSRAARAAARRRIAAHQTARPQRAPRPARAAEDSATPPAAGQSGTLSVAATGLFRELGMSENLPSGEALQSEAAQLRETIDQFTLYVYLATIFFFVVLFVGFAYELSLIHI